MNPFQNLFVFNASNDINTNFLKTLETLISFDNSNIDQLINTPIKRKIYTKISNLDVSSNTFKNMKLEGSINLLERENQSEATIEIIQKSHIGDFLIFKLIENLRRLYSAHRHGGRVFSKNNQGNNIEELKEQQNLIYDAFNIIKPYIKFDNSINFFKGSFLGEDKACNKADLFFFLSFHENIIKENHPRHIQLFKDFFSSYSLNSKLLADNLINLSYPNHLQQEMKTSITLLDDNFYRELLNKFSKKDFMKIGSLALDLFVSLSTKNIAAEKEVKTFYFARLLNNKTYFSEKTFLPNEITSLKNYLSDCEECTNLIIRNLNTADNRSNYFINFCLEVIPSLKDENFLINVLKDNFPETLTKKIISKYDFNDDFILRFCTNTLKINGSHQILKNLVIQADEQLSSNALLNIISLDVNLIEQLNSIILKRKLGNQLLVNDNIKNSIKNMKI